jgi:hypothetical protein
MKLKFFDLRLLSLMTLVAACSDRPSHEKFPGGQGRTTDMQQAQTTQAVLGGINSLDNPLASGDERTRKAATPQARLAGRLRLAKDAKVPAGAQLFVAARPVAGGPPLAVLRIPAPPFPYEFQLTDANRMMEGTEFKGAVLLSIRVDQDGDPLSREPGDLGVLEQSYVGAVDLDLELEREDNPE